ncbi:hypothetical protein BCR42DRAFT_444770 [Absidia repens]|uniref:Uncharacterized protein n=1 Tax=Absidia repens TaxID=90262 RepID=A0A1X2HDW8_9FUNG|nr:hypothetical protein BCR42DRAFT_444770 [Absidia repens]
MARSRDWDKATDSPKWPLELYINAYGTSIKSEEVQLDLSAYEEIPCQIENVSGRDNRPVPHQAKKAVWQRIDPYLAMARYWWGAQETIQAEYPHTFRKQFLKRYAARRAYIIITQLLSTEHHRLLRNIIEQYLETFLYLPVVKKSRKGEWAVDTTFLISCSRYAHPPAEFLSQ